MFVLIWIFTRPFLADDPRTLWSGAREDRRKRRPSLTSGATVDYFRLLGRWPSRWRFCCRFERSAFLFLVRRRAAAAWSKVRQGVRQDNWSEGRFGCRWLKFEDGQKLQILCASEHERCVRTEKYVLDLRFSGRPTPLE